MLDLGVLNYAVEALKVLRAVLRLQSCQAISLAQIKSTCVVFVFRIVRTCPIGMARQMPRWRLAALLSYPTTRSVTLDRFSVGCWQHIFVTAFHLLVRSLSVVSFGFVAII